MPVAVWQQPCEHCGRYFKFSSAYAPRYHPFRKSKAASLLRPQRSGKNAVKASERYLPYDNVSSPQTNREEYELRLYQPRFTVEAAYSRRDEAYLIFDRYLTGKNEGGLSLESPPPVIMKHNPKTGMKVMQMSVIPITSSLDAAALLQQPPYPNDNRLSLEIAGGEVIAAIQIPGQVTRAAAEKYGGALRKLLSNDGIRLSDTDAEGSFRIAQYDPVHSLKERTNELWLAVQL